MKITSLLTALIFCFTMLSFGFASEPYQGYGYTIEKPQGVGEVEVKEGHMGASVVMLLPVEGNFASNINVLIQPFPGSMDEYMKLSKAQFEAANLEVTNEEKIDENTVFFECQGNMMGNELVFAALAKSADGKVYLVTGTTTPELQEKYFEALKKSVKSLALSN